MICLYFAFISTSQKNRNYVSTESGCVGEVQNYNFNAVR